MANTTTTTTTSPGGGPVAPKNLGANFAEIFRAFAKFGDSKSTGEAITLSNSDKWMKQAKVIDPKKVTTTDTGIAFKKVGKTKRALTLEEYNLFLDELTKTTKKITLEEIKDMMAKAGPPATNKTTKTVVDGAVARLTDTKRYTGSHKQRFDEEGKGRGKAGRVDVVKDTGYVQGFKDLKIEAH